MWPLFVACAEDPQTVRVEGPFTVDGPIWSTAAVTSPATAPARYANPLAAAYDADPPQLDALAKARHRLCHEPPARRAILDALGPKPFDWRFYRVTSCDQPDYCDEVRALAEAHPDSAWWHAVRFCHDPRTRERLATVADDAAFAEYWWIDTLPFHPRLVSVVLRAFAEDAPVGPPGTTALDALGEAHGPEAEQALLTLFERAPPSWRDRVAVALWGRASPAAQEIVAEVCGRVEARTCGWSRGAPLDPVMWMGVGVEPERLFERFPEDHEALLEAIAECAQAAAPRERRRCVRALATRSPDRIPTDADADLRVATTPGRARAALAEIGVWLPEGDEPRLVLDGLDAAGLTLRVDEPAADAVVLLYGLAALAGLREVEFALVEPPEEPAALPGRTVYRTFFAWADGIRYRGLAPVHQPATTAAIPFANALYEANGLSVRAALELDGRRVVVAAPETLRRLADEQLVAFAGWVSAPATVPLDTGVD